MKQKLTITFVAIAAMVLAPAALAQKPPDNGAVDEYTEGVPGSGGETPSGSSSGSGGASGSDSSGSAVSPSNIEALESHGEDGAAAATLAQATAPDGAGKSPEGQKAGSDATSPAVGAAEPGGLSAAVETVTGDGSSGMGILLPILLGAIAVGVMALALRRRGGAVD